MINSYNHLILGGTFDHFHAGHELFLKEAILLAERQITIGVTKSELYQSKGLSQTIDTYSEREKNIRDFVAKNKKKNQKILMIPISDIYGTSLTDVTIDGIIVTQETVRGAEQINKKRKETGMKPLDVIQVPLVIAEDGLPISSFRIRYGDIDRNGSSYYKHMTGTETLLLPDQVRPLLREPLGTLFPGSLKDSVRVVKDIMSTISKYSPPAVFTIGDIICQTMSEAGLRDVVAVIDLRSRREALIKKDFPISVTGSVTKCRNRAGTIQHEAVAAIKQIRDRYMNEKMRQTLVVDGEEDLLALPAILLAPLGSFVLYGQHDQGVVGVRVTEEEKTRVLKLIRMFTY